MTTRTKIWKAVEDTKNSLIIHSVNLACNLLAGDPASRFLRKSLLSLIGAKIGRETAIAGGGYFGCGKITTGENVFINRRCYFDGEDWVHIGSNVVIGHGVTFVTAKHQMGDSVRRAGKVTGVPIHIGDGVWIGSNTVILPGVVIGKGTVVGAGSVVLEDLPENVVAVGVPAKVKGAL